VEEKTSQNFAFPYRETVVLSGGHRLAVETGRPISQLYSAVALVLRALAQGSISRLRQPVYLGLTPS